jgi:hypothetical protein
MICTTLNTTKVKLKKTIDYYKNLDRYSFHPLSLSILIPPLIQPPLEPPFIAKPLIFSVFLPLPLSFSLSTPSFQVLSTPYPSFHSCTLLSAKHAISSFCKHLYRITRRQIKNLG